MGILRTDRVSGLGGANAITGSAFFAGGTHSGGRTNVIGAVNLATEGTATKFGDLTDNKRFYGGTSNGHGGLG